MPRTAFLAGVGLVSTIVLSTTGARSEPPPDSLELTERGTRILEALEPTGETRDCIDVPHIRSSRVLGDSAILFEMRGRDKWLNVLDNRCPMLSANEQFTYSIPTSQLCSTDVVTVIIRGAGPGASCGLGTFSGYRDKPSDE